MASPGAVSQRLGRGAEWGVEVLEVSQIWALPKSGHPAMKENGHKGDPRPVKPGEAQVRGVMFLFQSPKSLLPISHKGLRGTGDPNPEEPKARAMLLSGG